MKRIVGCYCNIRGAVRLENNIDCNDLETILVDFQIQKYKTAPQLLFSF